VAVTILCSLLAALANEAHYYRQQNDCIELLTRAGASVVVRRSVPKWLYEMSGRRWHYVYAIHQHSCYGQSDPISTFEDPGIEDSESLSDLKIYFIWGWPQGGKQKPEPKIDEILPLISRCDRCRVLMLVRAAVADKELQALQSLGRLEVLCLAGTRITDAGLADLRSLRNLKYVRGDHARLSGHGAAELAAVLSEGRRL
jgi:hypothetical protein